MLERPRLRGVFHQYAFFGALVAGGVLVAGEGRRDADEEVLRRELERQREARSRLLARESDGDHEGTGTDHVGLAHVIRSPDTLEDRLPAVERGERNISLLNICRIAAALRCRAADLVGRMRCAPRVEHSPELREMQRIEHGLRQDARQRERARVVDGQHPPAGRARLLPLRRHRLLRGQAAAHRRVAVEDRLRFEVAHAALAELEHAYGDQDLIAIAERFETGRIGATDAIRIIGAAG